MTEPSGHAQAPFVNHELPGKTTTHLRLPAWQATFGYLDCCCRCSCRGCSCLSHQQLLRSQAKVHLVIIRMTSCRGWCHSCRRSRLQAWLSHCSLQNSQALTNHPTCCTPKHLTAQMCPHLTLELLYYRQNILKPPRVSDEKPQHSVVQYGIQALNIGVCCFAVVHNHRCSCTCCKKKAACFEWYTHHWYKQVDQHPS
jgi:hypothetical protein